MTINAKKTTYTDFSLSPKEQKALLAKNNPMYLGVTFDKRLTWKKQAEKAELREKNDLPS